MILSQGNLEERFSHLIQPIRDLAKNWDVNIADFLEEYLEDLEKIEITFSDGITTMNFSEAALLIQGSAGVYAKKVEYLYSLVCRVLDLVTQKKVKSTDNGEEGEDFAGNNDDDNDQFLPLDDLQDGNGIYHVEKDASTDKSIRVVQEMPTRLIPLEESEKGDNILYNKKGEMMGNHCDFNVNIGYISTDGSILLEMGDMAFLTMSAPLVQSQDSNVDTCIEEINHAEDFPEDAGENFDEVDGADVDVPGDDGDAPSIEAPVTNRQSQRRVTFAAIARPAKKQKPAVDHWAHLDPHEPSKTADKPLVKKKPFKIPSVIGDYSTKKRKLKKEIKELTPLHEIVEKAFSHRSKFPKNPLKVPEFPELEEAFWRELKLREAIKKEEIKLLKKEEREELAKEEQWEEEREGDDLEAPPNDDNFFDDVEDIPRLELDLDLLAQPGSMKRSVGSSDTGYQTGFNTQYGEDATLTYENLVQQYVERFYASAGEYAQITDLSRRVAEWEEKIQPKLEEEESHETFDIHNYGTFVIGQCVRSEPVAFREIVKGKKEFEICRYLLATLQLANVYNVELSLKPDESGSIMDCLFVTLLSTKRHFEDLEEYRAPSVTST
ncbi:hypothetical protein EGW08_020337 [Elysia chlorotica]|uniref:Condensin-2 complex subunit H2 n=1 Tax=Elysia chlorotica TaxID=188477 RepID=A0A3S0Z8P2_ELYCH|nr:hypothetical protein EGW08_020337 [Elysia chlorotica]